MKKCILIYDDNRVLLELCQMILGRTDRRVEMKVQCDHIISDIEELAPDIVLMDLWIPEMGGEKAATLIKMNHDTQHIPIILFSADPSVKEIAENIKSDGYLEKPFDIDELREIVEKHIL